MQEKDKVQFKKCHNKTKLRTNVLKDIYLNQGLQIFGPSSILDPSPNFN